MPLKPRGSQVTDEGNHIVLLVAETDLCLSDLFEHLNMTLPSH